MLQRLLSAIGLTRNWLAVAIFLALLWLLFIVASGAGWNPIGLNWDFSNPGAFGDSFGPLNTLMAGLAALGAIAAYRSQARELASSRARQKEQDDIALSDRERIARREIEADRRTEKASFEATYFNLLESLRSMVGSIDLKTQGGRTVSGHDSFAVIVRNIDNYAASADGDMSRAWANLSTNYMTDLNHYFRFLYHVILFVDVSSVPDKYFYVRLLRAMLSEPELVLLALNCAYGEGRDKFKELVERYSLLHNLSAGAINKFSLTQLYEASAFNRLAD